MEVQVQLDPIEARVFGVLVEKALTTPDQYPLSVNAATNGANQKSNRDPVLSLSEDEVSGALYRLESRYLARKFFPGNSRVEKFGHNGKEALGLDAPKLAVLAELLMRGPQTPGELRARVARMTPIDSLEQLMSIIDPLVERGYLRRLDPLPGSRAERYVQLVSPDLHPLDAPAPAYAGRSAASAPAAVSHDLIERIEALEVQIGELKAQVQSLAARLGERAPE